MGISTGEVVNTYIICRIIERIGDHAVRVAENGIKVIECAAGSRPPGAKTVQAIKSVSALSLSVFDRSIVSYFKADIRASNQNIESVEELEKQCEELTAVAGEEPPEIGIPLRNITESLRRAGEYAGDISENVLNHLVEDKI
jgi:phosphate uptake regulator